MSSRQFEPWRALEVMQPEYGSAYRLGGRLVLTAAHLVANVGTNCRVRAKDAFGEVDAKVVWKAQQADIALLELPDDINTVQAVVFGRLPDTRKGEKFKFDMFGYPDWAFTKLKEDKFRPEGRHIKGEIFLADESRGGLLVLEPKRLPSESQIALHLKNPEPTSPWNGSSGSAIVCDGLIIAVQIQHQTPERPASLEASPLWTIYSDEQWCNLLKKHGINPKPEIARLEPLSSKSIWRELFDNFLKRFSSEDIFSKDCKDLSDKVENGWIKSILGESFYNQVPIQLSLEQRLDLVELISPEQPEELRKLLPKGTKLTFIKYGS